MIRSTTIGGTLVSYFIVLFGTTLGVYESAPHIIVLMADDLVRYVKMKM